LTYPVDQGDSRHDGVTPTAQSRRDSSGPFAADNEVIVPGDPGETVRATADTTGPEAAPDARLAFIYQEALRGLTQQQAVVESLLNRAGILIFALSFANSLLGTRALADGLGGWDWIALGSLVGVGIFAVVMLWPYYRYWFRFNPRELIDRYIDGPTSVPMATMHRELALRIEGDMGRNGRLVLRMRIACQLALVLLLVNLLAWLLSIAASGGS
jgi:hypothetical protein